jgi:hypothetical protein
MVTVEELKSAITLLPEKEYSSLRKWILEKDWEIWDQELEQDSNEGKLDFLINEAFEAKKKLSLTNL